MVFIYRIYGRVYNFYSMKDETEEIKWKALILFGGNYIDWLEGHRHKQIMMEEAEMRAAYTYLLRHPWLL